MMRPVISRLPCGLTRLVTPVAVGLAAALFSVVPAGSASAATTYTIARVRYPARLDTDGTLRANFDNDSTGRWLFSNFSALQMLASHT